MGPPETPRGRTRRPNGTIGTIPSGNSRGIDSRSLVARMESAENVQSAPPDHLSISDALTKYVYYDKFDIYKAARFLVQRSRVEDVWPPTEAFLRSMGDTISDTTRPPSQFTYSMEEMAYVMQLMQLLNRHNMNQAPQVKVVQLAPISNSVLSKVGAQWNVERCQWRNVHKEFSVEKSWIDSFVTKETVPKSIARSFMMHILLRMTNPPQDIQKYALRTTRKSDSGYINLPPEVTSEILRITSDGFDLNRPEMSDDAKEADLAASSWYKDLGRTEAERRTVRKKMKDFKKICMSNFTEILKQCFPELRRCVIRGDRLNRVHHSKKSAKRSHEYGHEEEEISENKKSRCAINNYNEWNADESFAGPSSDYRVIKDGGIQYTELKKVSVLTPRKEWNDFEESEGFDDKIY